MHLGSRFRGNDKKSEGMVLGDTVISRGSRRRWTVRLGVLVLGAVALAACGRTAPEAPPKPHVSVAYPIVKQVIDWDDFIGRFTTLAQQPVVLH